MKRHFKNILLTAGLFLGILLGVFLFSCGFVWMVNEWHIPVVVWSLTLLVIAALLLAIMEEMRS